MSEEKAIAWKISWIPQQETHSLNYQTLNHWRTKRTTEHIFGQNIRSLCRAWVNLINRVLSSTPIF
jgi:hypothetical protein